jgi:mannose-6-phosphate isomerase
LYAAGKLSKLDPDFWAARAMIAYPDYFDRGIFSVYFFNLVQLAPGEGIFQGAGLPHAYLEGQNVELMSNSDNVLRGGLTPKHVDVPELMKHIRFVAVEPEVMKASGNSIERHYLCPVKDFSLTRALVINNDRYHFTTNGPELLLVLEGKGLVGGFEARRGSSFFITPGEQIECTGEMRLVRAWVP